MVCIDAWEWSYLTYQHISQMIQMQEHAGSNDLPPSPVFKWTSHSSLWPRLGRLGGLSHLVGIIVCGRVENIKSLKIETYCLSNVLNLHLNFHDVTSFERGIQRWEAMVVFCRFFLEVIQLQSSLPKGSLMLTKSSKSMGKFSEITPPNQRSTSNLDNEHHSTIAAVVQDASLIISRCQTSRRVGN